MKLKSILLAAVLGLSVSSAFAGLTLCSQGYPNQINVTCNGNAGAPIPANGCATLLGVKDLPWKGISALVLHSNSGTCYFSDSVSGQRLAEANIAINGEQGNVSNQHTENGITGLGIAGGPFGQMAKEVTATVVKQ